ncbi:nose resistant to fluoxetine protein 6 [Nephila pilipes]|uniref:Nose resistant to fluoxetine protein 6 n=1 Tax=Nephila pilipes TaxID=299642 RepID=A0A8X6TIC5_NEPPI|nr:nose resistant to fluoxetine protein 6 [Nephila pilipes]
MIAYKLVIVLLIVWCNCGVLSQKVEYGDKMYVKKIPELEKYVSASKNLELTANEKRDVFNDFESIISEFANENLFDSSKCGRDLKYVFNNLKSSIWAMKMLDAYGKPESGILRGNLKWLGDYDECLKVYAPPDTKTEAGNFHGKYCSLHVSVNIQNQSLPLLIGMCLPDSCNSSISVVDELNNFNFMFPFSIFGDQLKSALNNSKVTCQQPPEKLSTSGIFVILFIFIFALLAVIGSSITGYEYFMEINVEEKKAIEQNASERPHFSSDIENITAQKLNIEKDNKQITLPGIYA